MASAPTLVYVVAFLPPQGRPVPLRLNFIGLSKTSAEAAADLQRAASSGGRPRSVRSMSGDAEASRASVRLRGLRHLKASLLLNEAFHEAASRLRPDDSIELANARSIIGGH